MPGLPGQQRKGRGLLRLGGKAEGFARGQIAAQRFKPLRQHGHQGVVARAAAGDDVVHASLACLAASHLREHEPLVASGDGFGG
jgi:hypothetical protein